MANPHFRKAAGRHFSDATLLESNGRVHNADHLYGIAAECALKAILQARSWMTLADNGRPNPPHAVHINRLWTEYLATGNSRQDNAYPLPAADPFQDWSIDQRYGDDPILTVNDHRDGARACMGLLDQAVLDGIVP